MNNSGPSDISKRVAIFIHTPKDSKTAVFSNVTQRAQYLRSLGHQADIYAPEDFPWLPKNGRWHPLLYSWAVAGTLWKQRHRTQIAVFHSHAGWAFHFFRVFISSLRKIRTVTQFHGLEPLHYEQLRREEKLSLRYRLMQGWLNQSLIKYSCRHSDLVLGLNSQETTFLTANGWGTPNTIQLFSNGVASTFFFDRDYHSDVTRILFIGQWIDRKGVRSLAKAFTELAYRFPHVDLVCAGTLVDETLVRQCFPDDLQNRLRIITKVPKSDIGAVYLQGDLFVFPTLFEGFSLALLEAMATGLPIITTPVAAAVDILQDRQNALITPVNDTPALVKAITEMISNRELRISLGRAAQETARQYEWSLVCTAYARKLLQLT